MILRKLFITFSVALLLLATPAYAGWWEQLPTRFHTFETVREVKVKFLDEKTGKDKGLIATFKMRDGSCIQFKAMLEKITHARKCGESVWREFR